MHGYVFLQIGLDVGTDALLGRREPKGQALQQLVMQAAVRPLYGWATEGWRTHGGTHAPGLQLRQLLSQQLLGLEALPGRVAVILQGGQHHIGRGMMQKL